MVADFAQQSGQAAAPPAAGIPLARGRGRSAQRLSQQRELIQAIAGQRCLAPGHLLDLIDLGNADVAQPGIETAAGRHVESHIAPFA